jgi:putative ABC transport system permease protein
MMIGTLTDARLAFRNLSRNKQRTLVAIMTVASGVIAYLLAGGFIAWIFQDMREATIHSELGHAQIVRPGFFDKGIADPYAYLLPLNGPERSALEAMPGVVSVTPRIILSGLISRGDTTITFAGEGIDPVAERPISNRVNILQGTDLTSADERKVLLGEGLAASLGAKPGDSVVLLATAADGSPNAVELRVAGVFSTISKDYDDHAIRLPLATAVKLMRVSGATSWVVLLDATRRTTSFVAAARTLLPPAGFEIEPWTALADFYNKTVSLFSKQVSVMKLIIGIIIVLTITNTLTMTVLERTTEIGTSLAIGLPRRAVVRVFVLEGLLVGIAGGIIGILGGWALGAVISAIGIPMPPPPGMAHGYVGRIILTSSLATDGIVLAVATTLLATVLPAWKAGRMNIVDALRRGQ